MATSVGSSRIPTDSVPNMRPRVQRVVPRDSSRKFVPSMQLADFLDCDAIKPALPGGNKRSLLKQLAELGAQRLGLEPASVLVAINERERLGSTGFGLGVAIPHAKIDGLDRIHGYFSRLGEP